MKSYTEMKAVERCCAVVLIILPHKVVLPKFKPVWMKFLNVTIQMKATELCFLVVLWSCGYVFLLRWFSPFKSAEKILKCEHLNEIH